MSTLKNSTTICLPAHILDANISPRAREVLMLLASQTTAEHPTLWVCHAAVAERLRCSPVTVKRAIQKLVEAKLISETGDLHERRFKFYRVRWSLNERVVPLAKAGVQRTENKTWMPAVAGMTKKAAKSAQAETPKPIERITQAPTPTPTHDLSPLPKDSLFAQYYEKARQRHQEYLRRYQIDPSMFNKPDLPQWDNQDTSPSGF